MQGKFRLHRPSTGTVLGALALLVAAAGGGYAIARTTQPEVVVACQSNKMLFLADPTTGQCPPNQARVELTTTSYSGFARAGDHAALKQRVDDLKADVSQLQALLKGATRSADILTFSGMNLQITNGTGTTADNENGLGNLIVGYNEINRFPVPTRTGSHNLIVGYNHAYTSWGGIVGGYSNTLTGPAATAFGAANTASESGSSVTGGYRNTASGVQSSVSGGESNTASGPWSSILGGNGVTVNTSHGTSP